MNRFVHVLRRLDERLVLPQPIRSRVLMEIAADLEDLYDLHRRHGRDEEEARKLAEEAFDPSSETLVELVRLHAGPARRLVDTLSEQTRGAWERLGLGLLTVLVVTLSGPLLLASPLLADAGPVVWPVLVASLIGLLLALAQVYQLFVVKDHRLRRLRRGLVPLLTVVAAQVLLGASGMWINLFLIARRLRSDWASAGRLMVGWMHSSAALLTVTLLATVITAVVWFTLAATVRRIEDQEMAMLFETIGRRER